MPLRRWLETAKPLPGPPGALRIDASHEGWLTCAQDVAASGGRLLALWAEGARPVQVHAVLMTNSGKFAHYTPSNTGYAVLYAGLADCVESALTGRPVIGDQP